MFEYTKTQVAEMAEEMNYVRDTLEKVLRLSEILRYLNENPLMREHLALKGGTAINLTVFDLPRLSVDIDLDFEKNLPREDMLTLRDRIRDDLRIYMTTQGYAISPRSKAFHSLDSYVFTYRSLGGVNDNIKIEINYSLRAHVFEPAMRGLSKPEWNGGAKVKTLVPTELFAAKINALLGRAAARDLYDVHNMIRFGLFDESELPMLRKCVVFYTAISQDEIPDEYSFKRLDAITLRKIKTDLLPVIKRGEFVDLAAVKREVTDFLSALLTVTPDERAFLARFKNKEYCPELVFDDREILDRVRDHPMAMWKTRQSE